MEKEEFDLDKYLESEGLNKWNYEKYDYEKYRAINPKLTEKLYKILHENQALFKIVCGHKITSQWGSVVELEPVWHLNIPYNNQRRHLHGYDGYKW